MLLDYGGETLPSTEGGILASDKSPMKEGFQMRYSKIVARQDPFLLQSVIETIPTIHSSKKTGL